MITRTIVSVMEPLKRWIFIYLFNKLVEGTNISASFRRMACLSPCAARTQRWMEDGGAEEEEKLPCFSSTVQQCCQTQTH